MKRRQIIVIDQLMRRVFINDGRRGGSGKAAANRRKGELQAVKTELTKRKHGS